GRAGAHGAVDLLRHVHRGRHPCRPGVHQGLARGPGDRRPRPHAQRAAGAQR
ncbi:MAG: hypothetical protein AVDCRST_MAG12-1002, partial [uncultured Rubrobacteraceae bacterium]